MRFDCADVESKVEITVASRRKKFPRVHIIRFFRESIEFVLHPLLTFALRGISCSTYDCKRLLFSLLLVSYIADIPEAEDMLSVKRGVGTYAPCHNCLDGKDQLLFSTHGEPRTVERTLAMMKDLGTGDERTVEQFKQLPMISIPPVLSHFPLVGIHPCVDTYEIFKFEPMHSLSLGVSKLLKECCAAMLSYASRNSSAMRTAAGTCRPFNHIRRSVLSLLNEFLRETESDSAGYGLHLDYSKGECGGRLSGFFYGNWNYWHVGGS